MQSLLGAVECGQPIAELSREGVVGALAGEELRRVAERIEAEVPPRAPEPEAEGQSVSVTRPSSRRRRVFLPVDGLGRRPGGALALRQRLAGVPGVAEVEVDAVAGMAVVDYDATVCGLTRLLSVLDEESEADPVPSGTTEASI